MRHRDRRRPLAPIIIVGKSPNIGRDLPLSRQLDHVNGRRRASPFLARVAWPPPHALCTREGEKSRQSSEAPALLPQGFRQNCCERYDAERSPGFICDHESLRDLWPTALDGLSQKFTRRQYRLALSCRKVRQVHAFVIGNYLISRSEMKIKSSHGDLTFMKAT